MTSPCYAGALEDSMESFFLAETTKYLFLLFVNASALPDFLVFTTEGHLLPPFPAQALTPQPLAASHTAASELVQNLNTSRGARAGMPLGQGSVDTCPLTPGRTNAHECEAAQRGSPTTVR